MTDHIDQAYAPSEEFLTDIHGNEHESGVDEFPDCVVFGSFVRDAWERRARPDFDQSARTGRFG
jgi:hypothetical protein